MARKPAKTPDRKIVATNRKARHEYEFVETFEAGIALQGSEVKSVRAGKVSLAEAFGRVTDGEVWLIGMHIAEYDEASHFNHDPLRKRKLLLQKGEIRKITRKVKLSGHTLIPVDLYFNDRGYAKITLALAKGKRTHDRRESIKKRDADRELRSYK